MNLVVYSSEKECLPVEGLLALGVVENARLNWADREAVVGSRGGQAQVGIGGRWVGRDQS